MPWVPRGLRHGIVTSRYPHKPDGYGPEVSGSVVVASPPRDEPAAVARAAHECPTGAITVDGDLPRLDRGRCILCGRCAALAPATFRVDGGFETADLARGALVVPVSDGDVEEVAAARAQLARRVRGLRRSVHVRHVDAGSDGSEEWEVAALTNPVYDIQRLGVFFTASPKHADVLLVTGVGSSGMLDPLREVYEIVPEPKVVIATGVDAISGGLLGEGYASSGGVTSAVPVDVFVPGSPPTPFGILYGILLAVGVLDSPRIVGAEEQTRGPQSGGTP